MDDYLDSVDEYLNEDHAESLRGSMAGYDRSTLTRHSPLCHDVCCRKSDDERARHNVVSQAGRERINQTIKMIKVPA